MTQLLASRKAPLHEGEVVHLALGMARALGHLQSHHIVHRDFKLDNVLLLWPRGRSDLEHNVLQALVVVQGLELHLNFQTTPDPYHRQAQQLPLTIEETLRGGAVLAQAPEVLAAKLPADRVLDYAKNDAWALGVVLAQILDRPPSPEVTSYLKFDWHKMTLLEVAACSPLHVDAFSCRFSLPLRELVVALLHPNMALRSTLSFALSTLLTLSSTN